MNDANARAALVVIEQDLQMLTGIKPANCFIGNYEQVNTITRDTKSMKDGKATISSPKEHMDNPFNMNDWKKQ